MGQNMINAIFGSLIILVLYWIVYPQVFRFVVRVMGWVKR
jgi:hypothetical protein